MKKELFDLTIEEFTRLLCGMEKTYELEMKIYPRNIGKEADTLIGHYEDIHDLIKSVVAEHPNSPTFKQPLKYIEDNLFDYSYELDDLSIYDYLEYKTKDFEPERTNIILQEMGFWHFTINEERLEIINNKIESGWSEFKLKNSSTNEVDYEDAFNKIFGLAYDLSYYKAVSILKRKLQKDNPSTVTNTQLNERSKKYFRKAEEKGYIERTLTGYKNKFGSKALLAYFLERVFCRDDNGNDNGIDFPETALNTLFNESRLGKARGKLIDNRNGKPQRFKTVDELFE